MPPQAAQTIAEMAPVLAPMQTAHILVTGYTDNVPIGPELQQQGITSNQVLSMKRAQTVVQYLISQGVNPNLLTAQGLGDADPVASNGTAEGRAQNRRVELTLPG
jgi:chemotaxis protein MotB